MYLSALFHNGRKTDFIIVVMIIFLPVIVNVFSAIRNIFRYFKRNLSLFFSKRLF